MVLDKDRRTLTTAANRLEELFRDAQRRAEKAKGADCSH